MTKEVYDFSTWSWKHEYGERIIQLTNENEQRQVSEEAAMCAVATEMHNDRTLPMDFLLEGDLFIFYA